MSSTAGINNRTEIHYDLLEYFKNFYSREDGDGISGTKDTIDAGSVFFELSQWFNPSDSWKKFSENACKSLNPLSQGLAIPRVVKGVSDLWHNVMDWGSTDDWEIFNSAAQTANSGSEAIMFFDSTNIIPLKNWLNLAKGIFWGSAFSLDFVDFFSNIGIAEDYYEKVQEAKKPDVKAFYEGKLDFTFLKIVQNVATIALATLMILSIFFACIAEGFLFPPVTLGLTTLWLALNIFTFFYEQILNTQEKAFPVGALSMGKV